MPEVTCPHCQERMTFDAVGLTTVNCQLCGKSYNMPDRPTVKAIRPWFSLIIIMGLLLAALGAVAVWSAGKENASVQIDKRIQVVEQAIDDLTAD